MPVFYCQRSPRELDDSNIVPDGTTIVIGSWVYTANVSGGFTRRLANPEELEAPTLARRNSVDDFVDQLDKVPLPVHIENPIQSKSTQELEKDLDELLKIGEQEGSLTGRGVYSRFGMTHRSDWWIQLVWPIHRGVRVKLRIFHRFRSVLEFLVSQVLPTL